MTLYTYDIALDAANVRAAAALTERWIDTQRHWKSGRSVGADESACADDDASLTYRDRVDACARSSPRARPTHRQARCLPALALPALRRCARPQHACARRSPPLTRARAAGARALAARRPIEQRSRPYSPSGAHARPILARRTRARLRPTCSATGAARRASSARRSRSCLATAHRRRYSRTWSAGRSRRHPAGAASASSRPSDRDGLGAVRRARRQERSGKFAGLDCSAEEKRIKRWASSRVGERCREEEM